MKNRYCIKFMGVILGVVLISLVSRGIESSIYQKKQINQIQDNAYNYLKEKYHKEPIYIGDGSYYDSVFFYTAYFEEEDPFQVRYIRTSSSFEDDYLK